MTINSLASSAAASQIAAFGKCSKNSPVSQTSGVQQDSSQVSDLGELMKQLETLQKSDPDKYKATTAQIAERLEAAAKEAADSGDSQQASALNDMASKFKTASETGEMPDLQPSGSSGGTLSTKAHHGGRPPMGPPPMAPPPTDSYSDSTSSTDDSSSDTTSSLTAQQLSSYQSQSADPMGVLTGILQDVFSSPQTSSS